MKNGENRLAEVAQDTADDNILPAHVAGSGSLDRVVEPTRGYVRNAASKNSVRAHKADRSHFTRRCRIGGADPVPSSPKLVGLYAADLAAPTGSAPALSVATIERWLSGPIWTATQGGFN
ncbi:MAG: hypothetical protein NXH97_20325 [Rhodobacteraceae bacterium]|nr:hypothetical protein [Paracoccaceae bacterium]